MTMPTALSDELKEILVDLINTGIWATRERHDRSAIHRMDDEARFLERKGYYTNLDIEFEKLEKRDDLVERISDYINTLLPRQQSIKIIHPESFGAKVYTRLFLEKVFQNLGLEVVDANSFGGHESIVLISGVHNQEMVDFWREHDPAVELIVVLLGVSQAHINEELHLPSNKYIALASRDTLEQIKQDIRHIMIPHA